MGGIKRDEEEEKAVERGWVGLGVNGFMAPLANKLLKIYV